MIRLMLPMPFSRVRCSPRGLLASPRPDGIRVYWSGRWLYDARGVMVPVPSWWLEALPRVALDGYLCREGQTARQVAAAARRLVARRQHGQIEDAVFWVLDAPEHRAPFEDRLCAARDAVAGRGSSWIRVAPAQRIHTGADLRRAVQDSQRDGGVGVLLRRARGAYVRARTQAFVEVRAFEDLQATVVAHRAGRGSRAGVLGSLVCEAQPDGHRFRVAAGFSDGQLKNPPPVGAVVDVGCTGRSAAGHPRDPVFVGVCLRRIV